MRAPAIAPWVLCACLALPGAAIAQPGQCGKEREVPPNALDEATYNQMNNAYELVGKERYDEAYATFQRMLGRASHDDYLQAVLHQAIAQVEWSRERFDAALSHFEKAVELDVLPNQAHFSLMYQIAQLYFLEERYQEALDRLDLWFCTAPADKVTSAAWVLKASIHARMENYREVLRAIDTAIAMDPKPVESWYQLKLAAHYELEEFQPAAETLGIMVTHWPDKKVYWVQLAQTWFNLGQGDTALAVAALAYRKKLLDKQADILFLSDLYANAGVPFKAAQVLEQGMADGIVEANARHWAAAAESWYAAEELENSLAAYAKAGQAASDGDLDLRRGYILVDLERWPDAKSALDSALTKGGLDERKTGDAYLLRGMAEFNLGNLDRASADWGQASRYERTREAAEQWMNHLREERQRRAS